MRQRLINRNLIFAVRTDNFCRVHNPLQYTKVFYLVFSIYNVTMKKYFIWKILPFIISLSAFLSIIFLTPPPPNWHQASIVQIIAILLSLLFVLLFFFNLFTSYFQYNAVLSLVILVLIFLFSLQELNIASAAFVVISSIILIVVLSDFKLLKLRQPKVVSREPHLPPASNRVRRLRRLSYLTTHKK